MSGCKQTKIKFSMHYEFEFDAKSIEDLDICMEEIVERYLPPKQSPFGSAKSFINSKTLPARLSLAENEESAIERALEQAKNNISLTAKLLGITRATLYAKMKLYNITVQKELAHGDN